MGLIESPASKGAEPTVAEKAAIGAVVSPRSSESGSKELQTTTDSPTGRDVVDLVQTKPKRTWRGYFWDSLDKSPEERRFLLKLDAAVLTVGTLAFFLKYLDQVNINNAFVSGMREDLGLYGLELNYMQLAFTIGYIVGEIPSNLILTRIRPSYWLPACEVAWSVLTFLLARAKTPTQLYVLRFFIGLFESTCYPGIQYVIGSWYRKDELAKRSCIFHASGYVGYMFSGYLMAAVYNLDGVHGFKGWQWLFIIDGVISLPIAAASFFFLPDVPETTKAWFFSEDEVRIAKKRVELEGRANRAPYTWQKIKRILTSWHIWMLALLYIVFNSGTGGMSQPTFHLWLKSEGYSVWAVNVYPTFASVIGVVFTLSYAWVSDTICNGSRWPPMVFAAATQIVGQASLAAWDLPKGWKWFSFLSMGMAGGTGGMAYAWAHEITSADSEERAIVTAAMNELASVFNAWLPLVVWRVTEAPKYTKGFITMTVFWVLVIVIVFIIRHLHKRELAQKALGLVTGRV